tara:strand:- start:650 stop:1099 length:450 start_codon:yes stop_codon:yes gene_type:complete
MIILLQVVLAMILANFYEWWAHKNILHLIGKTKNSFWSFHWSDHHKACNQNHNRDDKVYIKEILVLILAVAVHFPVYWLSPVCFFTLVAYAVAYYFVHRKAHKNPTWGKKYLKWHWDHHMGKDQDANWCILFPLFDYVMYTRVECNNDY